MLSEKCIVIIGGTSGMGLSATKAFIEQGACVVAVGKDEDSCKHAKAEFGEGIRVVCGDAREETLAEEAIALCIRDFGKMDGLYHVAGGSGRKWGDGPVHEMTLEGWNKTLELNLTTVMLSNRAAIRSFLSQKRGGSILNMGSVLGYSPSPKYFTTQAYAAAKSAIIGFTKSIAAAYATDNIRANVLTPALVHTPMAQRAATNAEIMDFISRKQPLDGGRIGYPEDLDGIASLCFSDAGRFMTGQVIAVDGGWALNTEY